MARTEPSVKLYKLIRSALYNVDIEDDNSVIGEIETILQELGYMMKTEQLTSETIEQAKEYTRDL